MNKLLLFALSFILVGFSLAARAQQTFAPLLSPFLPSPELRTSFTILNTHTVSTDNQGNPKILRGMEPREKLDELPANGITDVLIFKTRYAGAAPGEDTSEIQKRDLEEKGIRAEIIPMPWKDIESPYSACSHTIKALKYMKEVHESPDRKMFAHCTVGEDRTGMLMGLFRMLRDKWSREEAFQNEMCRWGYERGNPNKPTKPENSVVCHIRKGLTPLFLQMAKAVKSGKLSWENLSDEKTVQRVCWSIKYLSKKIGDFKCDMSSEELDPAQVKTPEAEPVCDEPKPVSLGQELQYWFQGQSQLIN